MNIEFTDRYGGNPPSWLRGCLGYGCQATGYVPIKKPRSLLLDFDTPANVYATGDDKYLQDWIDAEKENPTDDGWHFITCHGCKGTGRVSWVRTILRLPRWIIKGIHFTIYAPNMSSKLTWKDVVLKFKCAFLVDLGLWKP